MVPCALVLAQLHEQLAIGLLALGLFIAAFEFSIVSAIPIGAELVPGAAGQGIGTMIACGTLGRAVTAVPATRLYERFGMAPVALLSLALRGGRRGGDASPVGASSPPRPRRPLGRVGLRAQGRRRLLRIVERAPRRRGDPISCRHRARSSSTSRPPASTSSTGSSSRVATRSRRRCPTRPDQRSPASSARSVTGSTGWPSAIASSPSRRRAATPRRSPCRRRPRCASRAT